MKNLLLVFALALGFAPVPALSASSGPPTAAQVEALLDAMDLEASQRAMLAEVDAATGAMAASVVGEDATAEDLARFQRIRENQHAWLVELLTSGAMHEAYRKGLRETLTAGEVEALTAFYLSAEGKRVMEKMPKVMAVVMQEMQPLMLETLERSRKALDAALAEDGEATPD